MLHLFVCYVSFAHCRLLGNCFETQIYHVVVIFSNCCGLGCMRISKSCSLPDLYECTDLKVSFLKPKHDQPIGRGPIIGATGGPCNGHLALSQVRLVEASAVGQLNSSPSLWQTWAESPAENVYSIM